MEKLFFNKGLMFNKRSDSFGKADKEDFSRKMLSFFHTNTFDEKRCLPKNLATIVKLPNITWLQKKLFFLATIANRATNQDPTFFG